MVAVSFKYKKSADQLYRPVADLVLATSELKVAVSMYIDSGADISLIPYKLGKALGFQETGQAIKEITGIAGASVPYIIQEIQFDLSGYKFTGRIGWALTEEVPLLLGRLDIFRRFKIIFDEADKIVFFVPKRN